MLQMEAGMESSILHNPIIPLSYLSPCWLSSIRDFMGRHQIQLQLDSPLNFPLSRAHDLFLMDVFRCSGAFTASDLKNSNAVCIILQVASVSDIATADGKLIQELAIKAQKSSNRKSNLQSIRQLEITTTQKKLWQQALQHTLLVGQLSVTETNRRLLFPLGEWLEQLHQTWR